ncbi:MAG: methyltransferase domain-containing protein [Polyangiales bacterium]
MNAASRALQRLAARATALLPEPPALARLSALRAAVLDELTAEHAAALDRAQYSNRDVFAPLADALVREHRRRVAERAEGLLGVAARVDAWLPTDASEHVDDPALPAARRRRVIEDVDRFNRLLGSYVRFLDLVAPLLPRAGGTVLDVASGHGCFPLALAAHARDRGLRLKVIATDLREEYLAVGRAKGDPAVEFRVLDALALRGAFAPGAVDVITCTQSLHHLDAGTVAGFLAEALATAPGVLFVDAGRAASAAAGAAALSLVGTRDPVFVHDAWVSVRRAFVREELALIARCVPGGERVEAMDVRPGFVALRTRG